MQVTKEQIAAFLAKADVNRPDHRNAIGRMAVALWNRQTADEKSTESTNHNNGKGFNGADARWCSKMAEWYQAKGWLSAKQAGKILPRLMKYAGQLALIKNQQA